MTHMPTPSSHPLYDPAQIAAEAASFARGAQTALVVPVRMLARRQGQAIGLSLAACLAADLACLSPMIGGDGSQALLIATEAVAAILMAASLARFAAARFARGLLMDVRNEKRRIYDEEFRLKRSIAAQQLRSLDNNECEAGLRELGRIWASLQATNRLLQIQAHELAQDERSADRLTRVGLAILAAAGCLAVGFAFDPHHLQSVAISALGVIVSSGLGRQVQLWRRAHTETLAALLAPLPPVQVAAADPLGPVADWIDEVLTQRNEHEAFFRRPNGRALWQAGGLACGG